MNVIARDTHPTVARMLDSYDSPAILVSRDYEILATNDLYRDKFGELDPGDDKELQKSDETISMSIS